MRRMLPAVACGLILVGCGKAPIMVPVKGIVKINHEPAEGVHVHFWPVVSDKDNFGYRHAVGITDGEGHFLLKCSRDGLLGIEAGEYHVTFSKPVDPPKRPAARYPGEDEKRRNSRRVESIPLPYSHHARPQNSPCLVTVTPTSEPFTFDVPVK